MPKGTLDKAAKTYASVATLGMSDRLGYGIINDELESGSKNDGGFFGHLADQVYGKDKTPDFVPPELAKYKGAPDLYKGALDPSKAGRDLKAGEKAAGITNFDPAKYREALLAGLRTNLDAGAAKAVRDTTGGKGGSELDAALAEQAGLMGDEAFATAAADIETGLVDKQLTENADRRRTATALAETELANKQFGARHALDRATMDEQARQNDNSALYGGALDAYTGRVSATQREQDKTGAILAAGANLGSSMVPAVSEYGKKKPVAGVPKKNSVAADAFAAEGVA